MIDIVNAVFALYPNAVNFTNNIAYDAQGNEVSYDKSAAEAKLVELQAAETAKQQAAVAAKESAQAKLAALGLTPAEVTAIIGN